jgi:hypothetical protein
MIADVERAVARKARNRKRREREHLEQARHEPPQPYRRTPRARRDWHGTETRGGPNRRQKRQSGWAHLRPLAMLEGDRERARGERRRQRAHRRRMARR